MTKTIAREELDVERHRYSSLVIYEVTQDDLDNLERETLTISEDFSFALACLTCAISFTVAIASVDITNRDTHDIFWIVMIISYIGSLFFGIRWFRARRNFKTLITRVKERTGTLGEEGHEIGSAELETLSSEEAK